MKVVLIGAYFCLFLVAIVITYSAYKFQKKFPIKYASLFFTYVLVSFAYWILAYAVPELGYAIFGEGVGGNVETFGWLVGLFSLPLTFITVYLFVALFLTLKNGKIPRRIPRTFFVLFILYFLGTSFFFLSNMEGDIFSLFPSVPVLHSQYPAAVHPEKLPGQQFCPSSSRAETKT